MIVCISFTVVNFHYRWPICGVTKYLGKESVRKSKKKLNQCSLTPLSNCCQTAALFYNVFLIEMKVRLT